MPIAFATYTKEAGTTNGSCFFSFYFLTGSEYYLTLNHNFSDLYCLPPTEQQQFY